MTNVSQRTPRIILVVFLVLSLLVGATGASLAVFGLSRSGEAIDKTATLEAITDAIIQARSDARKRACDDFNVQQVRSINGTVETIDANNHKILGTIFADITPAERQQLEQLYAAARADTKAVAERQYPLRRCDAQGIDAYYDDDPATDPYIHPKETS